MTAENARQFLENEGFHHSLLLGDPKPDCDAQDADIVIGIAAQINEGPKPWLSLRRQILRAAAQLDGGPSGIVAVHYSDPVDEFESLRPGDRRLLQEIAELIHPLPHVAAVFLSSEPDLQIGAEGLTPWRRYSNPRLPVDFPAVSALDDPT